MGFTIEDMMLIAQDRYEMKLVAGENGWANSISWLMMVEDLTIISNFRGKELAVTTCLGFDTEEKLIDLIFALDEHHAAGLVINTGFYLMEISDKVKKLCDDFDLPLLTVPWNVVLSDMIKDLSVRIFLQGTTDEQISQAFIQAIENPEEREQYSKVLLSNFDMDGIFQVLLLTTEDLDSMDTVERKRVGYRLQIYLENISHNGHFLYYNGCFVLIINAVSQEQLEWIITGFKERMQRRMPDKQVWVGVGSRVTDIVNLHVSYKRALSAIKYAKRHDFDLIKFDDIGVNRLLYSIEDYMLLKEMGEDVLKPLMDHDSAHSSDYVETLYNYLKYDGSIQMVSQEMYIHRNTIMYRMNKIRELLNCKLETSEERLPYQIACLILRA